jgi:hypothetical protein
MELQMYYNGIDLFFTGPASKSKQEKLHDVLNRDFSYDGNEWEFGGNTNDGFVATIRFNERAMGAKGFLSALRYNRMIATEAVRRANLVGKKFECTGSEFYVCQPLRQDEWGPAIEKAMKEEV